MEYVRELPELNLKFVVNTDTLIARAYKLKTNGNIWAYKFKSIERINELIQKEIDSVVSRQKRNKERAVERKQRNEKAKADIKVGDIYCYTFSYENTYRHFYQVTRIVKTKIFVKRIKVESKETAYCSADVRPIRDSFYGEEIQARLVSGYLTVGRDSGAQKASDDRWYYTSWGY